jgi:hypothetical protein
VLTAQDDGSAILSDPELLDRAAELRQPLFTCEDDLLAEASCRQAEGIELAGVIFIKLLKISIGQCVWDLELIAKAGEPENLRNHIQYLPF